MSAHMDVYKRSICDQIQEACTRLVLPADRDFEVHALSPLETMIRIPTDQGPRYFSVKVTEKL